MATFSLNASMRNNLLSLQNVSKLSDATQNKLATGLKVNSAIDNANSYYTALSLTSRAQDLSSLLDSMGQGIETLKAVSNTLEIGSKLLGQAETVANQALFAKEKPEVTQNVSTKEELLLALSDNKITKIIIEKSITFQLNEQLFVGQGKTIEGKNSSISLDFKSSIGTENQHAIKLANATIKNISINFERTASGWNSAAINGGSIEGVVNISTKGYGAYGVINSNINGTANITTNGNYAYGSYYSNINGVANIQTKGNQAHGTSYSNINGVANIITSGERSDGAFYSHINGVLNTSNLGDYTAGASYSSINSSAIVKMAAKYFVFSYSKVSKGAELWLSDRSAPIMSQYIQASDSNNPNGATGKSQNTSSFHTAISEYMTNGTESSLLAKPIVKPKPSENVSINNKTELLSALNNDKVANIIINNSIIFADNEVLFVKNGKTITGKDSSISLNFRSTLTAENQHAIHLLNATLENITINFEKTSNSGKSAAINGGYLEGLVKINTKGYGAYGVINSDINGIANITTNGTDSYGAYYSNINGIANIITTGENGYGASYSNINDVANILTSGILAHGIYKSSINSTALVKVSSSADALSNTIIIKNAELWLSDRNAPTMKQYIQASDANTANGATGKSQDTAAFKVAINEYMKQNTESDLLGKLQKTETLWSIYENQYNNILSQFDFLINDSSYKGVNLLQMQNLEITFNEFRSSRIQIDGVDASTKGLHINEGSWSSLDKINTSITEIRNAINMIHSYSSEFGNYNSIITNREEFTQNLITVLTEGADKLTLADMKEESASMLALQTRQQLAINSLSLASQAAQSILRLF